jgi:hypothetical protein
MTFCFGVISPLTVRPTFSTSPASSTSQPHQPWNAPSPDHLDGQGGDFHLDLHNLTFVDSSGAKVLMHAHNRVESLGRPLVMVSPTRAVRKVLDLMGFDNILAIEDRHW